MISTQQEFEQRLEGVNPQLSKLNNLAYEIADYLNSGASDDIRRCLPLTSLEQAIPILNVFEDAEDTMADCPETWTSRPAAEFMFEEFRFMFRQLKKRK